MRESVVVDTGSQQAIRSQVARVLRDVGAKNPPVSLENVRQVLDLDLRYYSISDTGLLSEVAHQARLLAHRDLPHLVSRLKTSLKKIELLAFWVPAQRRVLVDETLPETKRRWVVGHEIGHSIVPWHRDFLFGDDSATLDPACHEVIEAEANFAAGELLFMQDAFTSDARDLPGTFASIQSLAKRYDTSYTSTLRRFVERRDPGVPAVGLVSAAPRRGDVIPGMNSSPRHFLRSPAFTLRFPNVLPHDLHDLVCGHTTAARGGLLASAVVTLPDVNGEGWAFSMECFSNTYDVLTYAEIVGRA